MIRAVQCLTAAIALAHALAHAGGLEATFGADDDDTSTKTGDVDCVMGPWSAVKKQAVNPVKIAVLYRVHKAVAVRI